MFENVLGQNAAVQLCKDIGSGKLAPAMLFHGPPSSGKGTAGLELARYISCENVKVKAAWNCSCSACARHRMLLHQDLLCLGSRNFSAETAAAAAAFLRETENAGAEILFIRSVRKLLARFNPVLWEDESKVSKINPIVSALEEDLDVLENGKREKESFEKIISSVTKNAFKLESEGITDAIPIGQLRRSAAWAHLLPSGNGKILIIENADRMQEGARNSLLKLLEEPPEKVTLILTTTRQKTLLPTILSRLRPYRFEKRDAETQKDVIRRVFRSAEQRPANSESKTTVEENLIEAYLDSFLPVSAGTIEKLASMFADSAANKTSSAEKVISIIIKEAEGFQQHNLFSRFLTALLDNVLKANRIAAPSPRQITCLELWKKSCAEAESAVSVYNQTPVLALERLFNNVTTGMAGI